MEGDRAALLAQPADWVRAHPPAEVDPAAFDYAAEDAALAALPRAGETRS